MNAPAETPYALRSDRDGIATVTLSRPAARNALSMAMMAALHGMLDDIHHDTSVKVVILAAEGPAFCAGHDLKEMRAIGRDADRLGAVFARCSALMQRIQSLRQPVIARVHAMATAAGCQLVATADLAIAAETAKFATPGVNIGLFCSTPMVALTRNVPRKQAMEMLLTGEAMDAATAERFGLINHAVPPERLDETVHALAARIASKSPLTLAIGKEAFYAQIEKGTVAAYDHASAVMTRNMLARDAQEGVGAFIDKRPPVWEGC
ncbi:enoyl-CoA hydratase [Zavarzinia compransoris]|uniref:Enoyl-CoA hydratase domain-containing protein 3, mitochondrial n=1 Tax=Zavarzinia compransoris TaxID=1264899 RepID=A0A317E8T8_9PROT|nr:enoyl-CoA hydratase [Zavarzinia compransoris]PWR23537.1 enoyl-CoA hydratase [Zavarzinia compransoris]TDP47747.1 enoyl-CoA hydratase/carnithine racemase [Zavarzinia compransoris]